MAAPSYNEDYEKLSYWEKRYKVSGVAWGGNLTKLAGIWKLYLIPSTCFSPRMRDRLTGDAMSKSVSNSSPKLFQKKQEFSFSVNISCGEAYSDSWHHFRYCVCIGCTLTSCVDLNGNTCAIQYDLLFPATSSSFVGCGNSEMSYKLYQLGYKNIVNVDYSEIVIQKMAEKYSEMEGCKPVAHGQRMHLLWHSDWLSVLHAPGMTWQTMDMYHLDFPKRASTAYWRSVRSKYCSVRKRVRGRHHLKRWITSTKSSIRYVRNYPIARCTSGTSGRACPFVFHVV